MRHIHSLVMFHDRIDRLHATAPGYLPRRDIRIAYDGIDFPESEGMESVVPASDGRFRGISFVPVGFPEQIADFRHLAAIVILIGDAALADKRPAVFLDHGP